MTRAVHIEIADSLSYSAFIYDVQQFTSIRGKIKIFWSDRGINFIGATQPTINIISIEDDDLKKFIFASGTK